MKELTQTISFLEAKNLLRIRSNSTLANFFKRAEVKIISKASSPLAKLLFDKESFCRALKIDKLPEQFLTIDEVAAKLSISKNQVKYMCATGLICYYQINDKNGNKFLFSEDDLPNNQTLSLTLNRDLNYYVNSWKFFKYEKIIKNLLSEARERKILSDLAYSIISDFLKGKEDVEVLASKYNVSERAIRRYFHMLDRLIYQSFDNFCDERDLLKTRVLELEAEIARQRVIINSFDVDNISPVIISNKVSGKDPFLIKISEISFSARTHNAFLNCEINTLGELISFRAYELMRIQNFGCKSLEEVRNYLKVNNLKLKDD